MSSSSSSSAAQRFLCFSLALFLFSSFSSALRYPPSPSQLGLTSTTEKISPKGQAERLIRSFNLFPKHDANIVLNDQFAKDAPAIVERQFSLNVTAAAGSTPGPSIQQFGHYAGYYSLPKTKGAK